MHAYLCFVLARRRWVMAAVALLTVFFGLQINQNVRIVIDPAAMLPQQHPNVIGSNVADALFGSRHVVVVGVSARNGGSVYQPAVMATVDRLSTQLLQQPGVKRHTLTSATTGRAKAISGHADALDVEPMLVGAPTEDALKAMRRRLADNPIHQGVLVSADERVASVSLGITVGAAGYRAVVEPLQQLVAQAGTADVDVRLSGAPVFYAAVEQLSQRIVWLFPLALVLIGLIHLEAFRTWQGLVLPLVTAVLAVVWGLGLMGTARVPMDAFNATTPILILAVAAGHAVQILKRYYEEFERLRAAAPNEDPARLNERAVLHSLTRVAPVMLVAGGVAAAGFFSLLVFEIRTIRTFGLFTGLGIVCALVIELSFIPALRASLPAPRRATLVPAGAGHWDRAAAALARLVIARRRAVLVGFAAVAALCGVGLLNLNLENSTKSYFAHDLKVRDDDRFLNAHLAGTNTLYVVLQGQREQMKDPAMLAVIEQAQRHIESLKDVGKTLSIVDFLRQMHRSMNGGAQQAPGLPATADLVSQYLLLYGMSGDPTDFDAYLDYDAKSACVIVWMKNDSSRYSAWIVDEIQRYLKPRLPAGVTLQIGGSVPQTSALAETLVRGKLHNIAQMMAVVLVAGALVFRSLWAGVVLALPLAMAVMVNFGVMGLTGIPLNTPTSVSAAMTIGLGADYAIYLLYRMREEMARGGDLDQAIAHSLRSAGQAVIYVATAIAGGYSVLLLSAGFYIHIWFGVLIVVSTLVSALSALMLVPALVRSHPPRFLRPAAGSPPASSWPASGAALLVLVAAGGLAALASTDARAQAQAAAPRADELMQRNHQATRVAHAISQARFVLISPGGQERVRDMLSVTRLQPDGVNNRRAMRFLSPGDVRNTATLIIEQAGAQDDIWVYLPALKKTRRIASDNKKGSFVGSDLSYADMVGHRPADWTHSVLRSEVLGGVKTWVVESMPRNDEVVSSSGYGKRVSWVAESSAVTLKADFFDPGGQLLKTVENSDLRPVQGQPQKWVVMKVQVKNHQTGHQTQVIVSAYDSQTAVGDEFFSTRWIEKEQ